MEKKPKKEKIIYYSFKGFLLCYYKSIGKYLIIYPNQKELWTNSFSIIREEINKNLEFTDYDIEAMKEDYFEGNFQRFLRKHRKNYYNQLSYSKVKPIWYKSKEKRKAWKMAEKLGHNLPGEVNNIINIMLTMEKNYDFIVNADNIDICADIYFAFLNDIRLYNFKRTSKNRRIFIPNEKDAFEEQLARGFIPEYEFEDFDPLFSHVYSNIEREYLYPKNILSIPISLQARAKDCESSEKNLIFDTIYKGLSSIGVAGYTRIQKPKK